MIGRALDRVGLTGTADRYAVGSVLAWLLWVAASPIWSGRLVPLLSPYLVAPVTLVLGIVAGRALTKRWFGWHVPAVAAVLALVVLVVVPFYVNAQAAVGVQLVALTGLILLTGRENAGGRVRAVVLVSTATTLAVLGMLLATRSQAATVLVVPLTVVVAAATLTRRKGPPRFLASWAGFGLVAAAAAVVAWLGSRSTWPAVLTGDGGLSSARHTLWSDALELWAEHPLVGGGPGSFFEHSALASSIPHLDTVHSAVLQVGSELGLVGVVLFLCVIAAGFAIAVQGPRPSALLAVLAWAALGVHSMIDHLYEFPVVTVLAGIVLGWGGRPAANDGAALHRPRLPAARPIRPVAG